MRRRKNRRVLRIFQPPPKKYFVLNFINLLEVFLIFSLIGLFVLVLKSDFFKLAFVDCEKEGFLCSDEEKSLFDDVLGKNIFLVNEDKLIDKAKFKNITLKKVEIEKKLPNRLVVRLEERKPLANLSNGEANFLVDETGFVFSLQKEQNSGLPIIKIEGQQGVSLGTESGKKVARALELIKVLNNFFIPYDELLIGKNESLTLYAPNFIATFSAIKDFDFQVGSLQLLLRSSKINQQKKITKIDLRFDKPVLIFK